MAEVIIKDDLQAFDDAAAQITSQYLNEAIDRYGRAVWVLAGGSTPLGAYDVIAKQYAHSIDWEHVQVAMGDERCVPPGHIDSNWVQASTAMIDRLAIPEANKLAPPLGLSAEKAAKRYAIVIAKLAEKSPGIPRLDHVWFGIGDDGHTFSLFPNHPALSAADTLVVPVHNSPKPPPDRISLSLKALTGAGSGLIMISGAGKAAVAARAVQGDTSLPIAQVAATIEASGGKVIWLLDRAAASQLA